MARLTRLLIGINVAVFALEAISGPGFLASFALWPVGHFIVSQFDGPVGFKVWQLITCGFLHANFLHLAINMYALWMFGSDVERAVGPRVLSDTLFCLSAFFERDSVTSRLNDDIGRSLSNGRRVRRDLRSSARLRHAFSTPHHCPADSANPDASDRVRNPLRAS